MKTILALLPKELLIQIAVDTLLAKLNEKPEGKFSSSNIESE
jgi:hypothetical protein